MADIICWWFLLHRHLFPLPPEAHTDPRELLRRVSVYCGEESYQIIVRYRYHVGFDQTPFSASYPITWSTDLAVLLWLHSLPPPFSRRVFYSSAFSDLYNIAVRISHSHTQGRRSRFLRFRWFLERKHDFLDNIPSLREKEQEDKETPHPLEIESLSSTLSRTRNMVLVNFPRYNPFPSFSLNWSTWKWVWFWPFSSLITRKMSQFSRIQNGQGNSQDLIFESWLIDSFPGLGMTAWGWALEMFGMESNLISLTVSDKDSETDDGIYCSWKLLGSISRWLLIFPTSTGVKSNITFPATPSPRECSECKFIY